MTRAAHFSLAPGLLLAALGVSCAPAGKTDAPAPAAVQTIEVTRVISRPLDVSVPLPGELQPYEAVAVFSKIAAFVDSVRVDRGSRVRKGQLLAELKAPELVSQRAEAEARAAAAQSQLLAAQAKLSGDLSTYEKLRAASQTTGVVAGNDLLLAQKSAEADQAQVEALQENAQAAQQALRALAEVESYLRITAPFDGIITERNAHPGSLIRPGDAVPMLRVETLSRLRLVVPVPETYVSAIPQGTRVAFTVPAFPDTSFTGAIARIAHSIDSKTRTMPVEIEVSNPEGRLTPGTYCQVQWPLRRARPSLFVPASSIATNLERNFVLRVRQGKVEWVDVKTGASSGALIEIFGSLQPGDVVALRGTDTLAPGTPVSVHESKSP